AERRQRHLLDGIADIAHLDDGTLRIENAVPNDGIDLDRHVVPRDALLLLDVRRHGAQVHLLLPFDEQPDQVEPGPRDAIELAEAKDDATLILIRDAETLDNDEHGDHDDGRQKRMRRDQTRDLETVLHAVLARTWRNMTVGCIPLYHMQESIVRPT